jgi:hypothetical protein
LLLGRTLAWTLALLVTAAAPACSRGVPASGAATVRAVPLPSEELTSAFRPGAGATPLAGWRLSSDDPRLGGLSGILVEQDRLLLVSDRGWLWTVARTGPGPAGLVAGSWRVGELVLGGRPPDAEALARESDGRIVVATEGTHRIARLPAAATGPRLGLAASRLPGWLAELPANQGVEALATLPDGRLLAIAEAGTDDLHPAAILGGGPQRRLLYRSAPGFAPTGADRVGPWLLVLERRLSPLSGFTARVTATPVDRIDGPEETIEPAVEIARLAGPGLVDNMEGIAAEPIDGGDGYRLWLVSDDNFSPLQRTLLILLEWRPQALARASSRRFMRTSSAGSSASPTERR